MGWILHHQCCSINPFMTPMSTHVKTRTTLRSPPELLIPYNGETWGSLLLPSYKLDSYSEHLKVGKIVTFPIVFPISHHPLLPFQKFAPLNSVVSSKITLIRRLFLDRGSCEGGCLQKSEEVLTLTPTSDLEPVSSPVPAISNLPGALRSKLEQPGASIGVLPWC